MTLLSVKIPILFLGFLFHFIAPMYGGMKIQSSSNKTTNKLNSLKDFTRLLTRER